MSWTLNDWRTEPKSQQYDGQQRQRREWFLVQRTGTVAFKLNTHGLIVVGSENCDINIQSPSVDKRHAVLCFDSNSDSFSVKDLNSTNGTFLNNRRISSDRPERLQDLDLLRFGYDSNLYEVRSGTSAGPEPQRNDHNVTYSQLQNRVGVADSVGASGSKSLNVMQAGGRGNSAFGSRVSSPSLTLDSGRGSSSAPSSPAKEMSPVPVLNSNQNNLYSGNLSVKPSSGLYGNEVSASHDCELQRKDSLEEINTAFPQNDSKSKSGIISELDDINVPNEVFSEDLEPKEESPIGTEVTASNSKSDSTSRPESLMGGDAGPLSLTSEMSVDSDTSVERKKITPMAFTIDFDDGPKKIGIADSISKFAPKHRRNFSATKAEDLTPKKPESFVSPKKEGPSSSLASNQSVSESDSRKNVTKNLTARLSKGFAAKITPTSSTDNSKSERTENVSSALRKPGTERLNSKEPSSNSLFSNRSKPSGMNGGCDIHKPSDENPGSSFGMLRTLNSRSFSKPLKEAEKSSAFTAKADRHSAKGSAFASSPGKDVDKDLDDASSETGTYTVEKDNPEPSVDKARNDLVKMLGFDGESGTTGDEDDAAMPNPSAPEWVREWAEQAAILHKKGKDSQPMSDTRAILHDTEVAVSAIQARVSRTLSRNNSSHNSDSDDEATLSSPLKTAKRPLMPAVSRNTFAGLTSQFRLPREASVLSDSGYQVGYGSDSSNDGAREYRNIGAVKMNKAFSIRRGLAVGYDSEGCAMTGIGRQMAESQRRMPPSVGRSGIGAPNASPASSPISRNDGGRFSLRMTKSKPPLAPTSSQGLPTPAGRSASKPPPSVNPVSKPKVDANPNRRPNQKSLPPLNLRKPPTGSRSNSTLTAKEVELANWKRRKSYDPLRAAAEGRKKKETMSAAEASVNDFTPTDLSKQSAAMMSKSMSLSFHQDQRVPPKCFSEEEDMIYVVDEVDTSHSNSPIHIPMTRSPQEESKYFGMHSPSHSGARPKNKLEALDNLVIATIHSLSNKVRGSARHLLEKLQGQHADDENGALLEEMVSQLRDLELSSVNSSPNKSPSRELSGTLKNLKKLEQVILVLDRVLCDDSGSDANN